MVQVGPRRGHLLRDGTMQPQFKIFWRIKVSCAIFLRKWPDRDSLTKLLTSLFLDQTGFFLVIGMTYLCPRYLHILCFCELSEIWNKKVYSPLWDKMWKNFPCCGIKCGKIFPLWRKIFPRCGRQYGQFFPIVGHTAEKSSWYEVPVFPRCGIQRRLIFQSVGYSAE